MRLVFLVLVLAMASCSSDRRIPTANVLPPPPVAGACVPGAAPIELTGAVSSAEAKTYQILPFTVGAGTGRVELSYQWTEKAGPPATPLTATTLDLGLWDEKGYRNQAGFRGWGGSRQGRMDQDKPPIFVEAGVADRGFTPGVVNPGTWFAELGIAAVSPQGADWLIRIECKMAGGETPGADPVDPAHVARATAGWYHGDFHMHAYHSNPSAPGWDDFIAQARAARLDFLMVTEYVTGAHWDTLGAVQRAHPDLLIWPGREIITYFGHVNTHGETPGLYEYRQGFEDVDIGRIQIAAKNLGALFQVNHPTIFPPPLFSNFCRGCYFELDDKIDWDLVDTIELVNGPVLANCTDLQGSCPAPGEIENPFLQTALDLWDDRLMQGHKITGVSGSDSKGVDAPEERARVGYGSSATAVFAQNLSRAALTAALQAGHAYVRTRGVERSPALEFSASAPDGSEGMFGDTVTADFGEPVLLRTTVTGGANQILTYLRNGKVMLAVPVSSDPFVHEFPAALRTQDEGPLGTYWRVETRDAQTRTAIGNPIFIRAP